MLPKINRIKHIEKEIRLTVIRGIGWDWGKFDKKSKEHDIYIYTMIYAKEALLEQQL